MDYKQDEGLSSGGIIRFPPVYAIDESWYGNPIRQITQPGYQTEVVVEKRGKDGVEGYAINAADGAGEPILAIVDRVRRPQEFSRVLRLKRANLTSEGLLPGDLSMATWERHPELAKRPPAPIDYRKRIEEAIESWQGAFSYLAEIKEGRPGLRPPQIGAIHAVHAHWTVSDEPATVVMPTGTGKTEAMLSVLVSARCPRLLVVVPTDALRTQISLKFLTLGILKDIGVVAGQALYPIVGVLRHMPRNCAEVDAFFERCHVVVTTMSVAGRCGVGEQQLLETQEETEEEGVAPPETADETWWREKIQQRMAQHCPFLFVDEAHHIAAQTWEDFKRQFESARVLQFTATPFRNDERPVGGRIIFNYPMRKAQEEGYFRPIRFEPVEEYNPAEADRAIAAKAVEQLRKDRDQKLDHTLMVRVESIKRAEEVFLIYEQYKEFNPVRIHTGMARKEQEEVRQQIVNGQAHIVVCVDMLGEGFDLPELKIAAFHDVRKSLAVTLQLAGRFTRSKSNLGNPTFIANIADVDLQQKLSRLYAQDADWNTLLSRRSEDAIGAQVDLLQFLEGFKRIPKDVPLQNIRPPLNFITYQTECQNWTPERFREGIQGAATLERLYHDVNYAMDTLVVVLARKVPLDWAQLEGIFNWIWELYVLYWDKSQNLLFIAGSHSGGYCRKLAEAVAGFSFDVPLGFENELARRVLSLALRQKFDAQGIVLSPGKSTAIEGGGQDGRWWINDSGRNRMYAVVKKDKALSVSVTVKRVWGPSVFRCFGGVTQLVLHNVGLTSPFGRHVRYTMRAGSNVGAALTGRVPEETYKSNIFGAGFEDSERTGVGCSRGGRVWSTANVNLHELTARCRAVGRKLLDEGIDSDAVLRDTLRVDVVDDRPGKMPITIEWPALVYRNPETAYVFTLERKSLFQFRLDPQADLGAGPPSGNLRQEFERHGLMLSASATIAPDKETASWRISDAAGGRTYAVERTGRAPDTYAVCYPQVIAPLFRTDIGLKEPSQKGDLLFEVTTGDARATFVQTLAGGLGFSLREGQRVLIKRGSMQSPLEEFFAENPPVIRFADGSFLEGSEYVSHRHEFEPYPRETIEAWDWTGTNITQESQGITKRSSSIQYRVIQKLRSGDFDVIYDDDGPGEAADVVAVRMGQGKGPITVEFYHCKFSKEPVPGGRTSDLYEVCGQAQKSIHWLEPGRPEPGRPEPGRRQGLFGHLLRRKSREGDSGAVSRLEKGDETLLQTLERMSKSHPIHLAIYIVQPGLSKAKATPEQLRLLSVTESYLRETYQLPFGVIASP